MSEVRKEVAKQREHGLVLAAHHNDLRGFCKERLGLLSHEAAELGTPPGVSGTLVVPLNEGVWRDQPVARAENQPESPDILRGFTGLLRPPTNRHVSKERSTRWQRETFPCPLAEPKAEPWTATASTLTSARWATRVVVPAGPARVECSARDAEADAEGWRSPWPGPEAHAPRAGATRPDYPQPPFAPGLYRPARDDWPRVAHADAHAGAARTTARADLQTVATRVGTGDIRGIVQVRHGPLDLTRWTVTRGRRGLRGNERQRHGRGCGEQEGGCGARHVRTIEPWVRPASRTATPDGSILSVRPDAST